jgi:hypothetical protein
MQALELLDIRATLMERESSLTITLMIMECALNNYADLNISIFRQRFSNTDYSTDIPGIVMIKRQKRS